MQGLNITENVFDHNGWTDSAPVGSNPSIYNHNMYVNSGNTGVVVRATSSRTPRATACRRGPAGS